MYRISIRDSKYTVWLYNTKNKDRFRISRPVGDDHLPNNTTGK